MDLRGPGPGLAGQGQGRRSLRLGLFPSQVMIAAAAAEPWLAAAGWWRGQLRWTDMGRVSSRRRLYKA